MEQFTFAQFLITLLVKTPIYLGRFSGATFRGGFGFALFKETCLLEADKCLINCPVETSCPYYHIFETPVQPGSRSLVKGDYAPHPFVILPPLDEKVTYDPGERIVIFLTLIGKAVTYLPIFLASFKRLGETGLGKGRGLFCLERVKVRDCRGYFRDIYDSETDLLDGSFPIISLKDLVFNPNGNTLILNFITPTKIKKEGGFARDLPFPLLFEAIIRRLIHLFNAYCDGEEVPLNYKSLKEMGKDIKIIQSNLQWLRLEHYSTWQRTRNSIGGFVGEVIYTGNFKEVFPYILAGEAIHVGKDTAYGCGKYVIGCGNNPNREI